MDSFIGLAANLGPAGDISKRALNSKFLSDASGYLGAGEKQEKRKPTSV